MNKPAIILSIVLILICAAGISGWIYLTEHPVESPVAEIYSDGVLIRTVDLSQDEIFIIQHSNGSNTISVNNGTICVTEASCPDKVCVNMGAIRHGAVPIICLPNRLEIRIISTESNVDAIL